MRLKTTGSLRQRSCTNCTSTIDAETGSRGERVCRAFSPVLPGLIVSTGLMTHVRSAYERHNPAMLSTPVRIFLVPLGVASWILRGSAAQVPAVAGPRWRRSGPMKPKAAARHGSRPWSSGRGDDHLRGIEGRRARGYWLLTAGTLAAHRDPEQDLRHRGFQ